VKFILGKSLFCQENVPENIYNTSWQAEYLLLFIMNLICRANLYKYRTIFSAASTAAAVIITPLRRGVSAAELSIYTLDIKRERNR